MSANSHLLQFTSGTKPSVRTIPLEEYTSIPLTERPLLIDVRGVEEWEAGHAEGAVHLGYVAIEQRIRGMVRDLATPVVCYCGNGDQSTNVAASLLRIGYTHVASLAGGFTAWLLAKEPVVKPAFR